MLILRVSPHFKRRAGVETRSVPTRRRKAPARTTYLAQSRTTVGSYCMDGVSAEEMLDPIDSRARHCGSFHAYMLRRGEQDAVMEVEMLRVRSVLGHGNDLGDHHVRARRSKD